MSKELSVDGRVYISTKDAAKETGYTHDYIGQISRAGKIPSKKVGRARFVERDAILWHKRESEMLKTQSATERSVKFKAGRKVPLAVTDPVRAHESQGDSISNGAGNLQPTPVPHPRKARMATGQATDNPQPTTDNLQPTTDNPQPTTNDPQPTTEFLPSLFSRPQVAAATLALFFFAGTAFGLYVHPKVGSTLNIEGNIIRAGQEAHALAPQMAKRVYASVESATSVADTLLVSIQGAARNFARYVQHKIPFVSGELSYISAEAQYRLALVGEDVQNTPKAVARSAERIPFSHMLDRYEQILAGISIAVAEKEVMYARDTAQSASNVFSFFAAPFSAVGGMVGGVLAGGENLSADSIKASLEYLARTTYGGAQSLGDKARTLFGALNR